MIMPGVSPDTVFNCLTSEVRPKWEELPKFQVLEKTADYDLIYSQMRKPLVKDVPARDVVVKFYLRKNYEAGVHMTTRVDGTHDLFPANSGVLVRASQKCLGNKIEAAPDGNGTMVTLINNTDYGAGCPKQVIFNAHKNFPVKRYTTLFNYAKTQ